MKLYNTLTHKVEEFIPHEAGIVKMYTCGPTVYHYAHIGNIRNYIGHDILEKTLLLLGYQVTRAMNITDVGHLTSDSDSGEDKMEVAKKREKKSALEIADFYTKAFFKDYEAVNCMMPDIVSKATDNIPQYIEMIEVLLDKGYAYQSGGNIYFDISKLDDYYVLTNHQEDKMVIGAREGVEEDARKHNQADFVLWFTTSKFENHELLWDSPWGKGYPGWHIECSGISLKYLGEYLDIHGGGVDNIFPHHTNEIAQSEAYLGHKWCNYWFHNEHLLDESGKMSKSKGEFLTISSLISKEYNPLAFRFMCLNSHYRKQLIFSFDALNQAEATLKKLKNRLANIKDEGVLDEGAYQQELARFEGELSNDLNTANAISVLYDVIKNEQINGHTKRELIAKFDKVLSLELLEEPESLADDAELLSLIAKRAEAKKNRDFDLADSIRSDLLAKGIELIDTREGTTYKVIGE